MPPRVVRPKTRLARLQQVPADPLDADEQTEQTPTRPTSPSPAPDVAANASSDGEQKEPDVAPEGDPRLFHGHRFYLARTLRTVRRHELRILISQNGGEVVTEMAGGAVEIVERAQLQPNENWVSAEFIEDSIEAGELKDVTQYMAPREPRPTRTPSGRPFKRFFSVAEQAAMLRFLKEQHPKYYNRATVPARIWKLAADQKLLDRSAHSMHEHYRKQLTKLTKKQRAMVFERAGVPNLDQDSIEGETEGETETDTEPRVRHVAAKTGEPGRGRPVAAERAGEEEEEENEHQPEEADQEARPREPVEPTTRTHGGGGSAESEDEIEGRARKRVKKSRTTDQDREEQDQVEEATGPTAGEEGLLEPQREASSPQIQREEDEPSQPQTPGESEPADAIEPSDKPQGAVDLPLEVNEALNEQSQSEAPGGEVFRSYWHGIAFDPATRHQLDRFFIPPPPPPVVEHSQNALLSTPVASAQRTPQRSRRLSNSNEPSSSHSTPTPQKRRRSGRTSMDSVGTPGSRTPARAAQEELLSQLEEMVGQRMTPPSRRKSLDRLIPVSQASESDADEVLSRLQFETAHDLNTICSALYWSSGDSNVARAFLLGHSPAEIWSPKDDQLLVDYMREDVTEAELANARHRGAFETMSTRRTARDILRRIQFLL